MDPNKRLALLRHIAVWVPADFALMTQVVEAIHDGKSDREALVEDVAGHYPAWSNKVANTNIAGYVGRSREWGLIEYRQEKRHYVLTPDAMDALSRAAAVTAKPRGGSNDHIKP